MLTFKRRIHGHHEDGSIAWAMLVAIALTMLGSVFVASLVSTVHRSKATTDATMLTQYTDVAVAAAIADLNTGSPVAATLADSDMTCEEVSNRAMCYRYWALPVPANAADPVRYDLVTRVWIDPGDLTDPEKDGLLVRSMKTPLEVITYQTAGALAPTLEDGYVAYQPTPGGLFANAIHSFTRSTLSGPALTVRSYNSQTGDTGTRAATVSSSGWLSFGNGTQADLTVLYGGASAAGDFTSRCTGEACLESGTRVIEATYATPTDASVQWMRTVGATACNLTIDGDWVASAHDGQLPAGVTCINGSLIVDTATTTTSPMTTLYVNGVVQIRDDLNPPLTGQLATPAGLTIYSTGGAIAFDAPAGTAISALTYAPLAACGTNPASSEKVTYYGSLVCNTVSLGGAWEHLYDDAAVAEYVDPVPGAAKTFSPGVPGAVDFDEFHVPENYIPASCAVTAPTGAAGYWKLDEPGILARDSSGQGKDAGWLTTGGGRPDGVCSQGAAAHTGGAVTGTHPMTFVHGMSVEYWAKGLLGSPVDVGGVRVGHDDTDHVTVTISGATHRVPFTVQNTDAWHLYTLTVDADGAVTLYVDGQAKGTVSTGTPPATLSGKLTIADGTAGAVDEVVAYDSVLTAGTVADRYTWWVDTVSPTTADPGTPFTAPTGVADDGTTPTLLGVRWNVPTGTFPTDSELTSYRVEVADTTAGPWTQIGTTNGAATTWQQSDPPLGSLQYRVCAVYNGDERCSGPVGIVTLEPPVAPTVSIAINGTQATATWNAVPFADEYKVYYRIDGGSWILAHDATTTRSYTRTVPAGTQVGVRVMGRNAAGLGAAGEAHATSVPAAPAVTVSSTSVDRATFTWPAVKGATGYYVAERCNGDSWTYSTQTSRSKAVRCNQGDVARIAVRAQNASGNSAYTYVDEYLLINKPTVGSMYGWSDFEWIYARLNGVSCPAGTVVQSRATTRWDGQDWGAWSTYANTGRATQSLDYGSRTFSYDRDLDVSIRVRCANTYSGTVSAETSSQIVQNLMHPVPSPTGLNVQVGGTGATYRAAQWAATCPANTSIRYGFSINATTFTYGQSHITYTRYERTAQAWGNGSILVAAYCQSPGGRTGSQVSVSRNF